MIRVYKSTKIPLSLCKQNSWAEEDVIRQLCSDQHGKCYLCERKLTTDFQVEHCKSRINHPELMFAWSNLFWCCGYCNGKKSGTFDNLLNPSEANIEELIKQTFDFPTTKVIFESRESSSPIEGTIVLLDRIFNGSGKFRTIREQQFYDYAKSRILFFQKIILDWLSNPSDELYESIKEQLSIDSEFLGFKYWIIQSNALLFGTFGESIEWNRR